MGYRARRAGPRYKRVLNRCLNRIRRSDIACLAHDIRKGISVGRAIRLEKPVKVSRERWVVTRRIGGAVQYWAGPYKSNGMKWVNTLDGAYPFARDGPAMAAVVGCELDKHSSRVEVVRIQ